jgi:hypothetical protein
MILYCVFYLCSINVIYYIDRFYVDLPCIPQLNLIQLWNIIPSNNVLLDSVGCVLLKIFAFVL